MAHANSNIRGIVKVRRGRLGAFLTSGKRPGMKNSAQGLLKIAPGFTPDHSFDLQNLGGKTVQNLTFMNVYLGSSTWSSSDMDNIDAALGAAMSDAKLNAVIQQYFGATVSTQFQGRGQSDAPLPSTYTRDDVSSTLDQLYTANQLQGITDFGNTVINLLLPPGTILDTSAAGGVGDADDKDSSLEGLGGYHGSHTTADGTVIYFAVAVYSQQTASGTNGIPVWPDSWKNVVATLYHELNEARTDADVEEVNRSGNNGLLGWYSSKAGEIGDIPIEVAGNDLHTVFVEVPLTSGQTAPIQLMWSNQAGGPGEP